MLLFKHTRIGYHTMMFAALIVTALAIQRTEGFQDKQ